MAILGLDDTDSSSGMCTTYLIAKLILKLAGNGIDVIGYPRLVRLNPNIPYKTRGNGALAISFGVGKGGKHLIMKWNGKKIFGYEHGSGHEEMWQKTLDIACELVDKDAHLDCENTHPGVVILGGNPENNNGSTHSMGNDFYLKSLREIVEIREAENFITDHGGSFKKIKSGRGIIGAAAACAWAPGDRTYEIITYRFQDRVGSHRNIDHDSVMHMDRAFPDTFDNYDYGNKYIAVTPSSPCPVLFGIRSETPHNLVEAAEMIHGEDYQGFVIFETNQGTDDHLLAKTIQSVKPYESVILMGKVIRSPRTIPGGHVVFSISDPTGEMECIAYEPTKEFRHVVRELIPGDEVVVYGGMRKEPFTLNLEKIRILHLEPRIRKISNPICGTCGKHMKSVGEGEGYRCRGCGTRALEEEAKYEIYKPKISSGWFEVPVCARRHLSKPLKRMVQ